MSNIYTEALGAYLRRYGLTQQSFGDAAGFSQTVISQWLAGTRFPSKKTARRLDEATNGEVSFSLWKATKIALLDA
jgi:transcriptional regulator with XRE-family HTH domain